VGTFAETDVKKGVFVDGDDEHGSFIKVLVNSALTFGTDSVRRRREVTYIKIDRISDGFDLFRSESSGHFLFSCVDLGWIWCRTGESSSLFS